MAAAVDQCQRPVGAEIAQVEQIDTRSARARLRAGSIEIGLGVEQSGALREQFGDVVDARLDDVLGGDRDHRGCGRGFRSLDAGTGDDDRLSGLLGRFRVRGHRFLRGGARRHCDTQSDGADRKHEVGAPTPDVFVKHQHISLSEVFVRFCPIAALAGGTFAHYRAAVNKDGVLMRKPLRSQLAQAEISTNCRLFMMNGGCETQAEFQWQQPYEEPAFEHLMGAGRTHRSAVLKPRLRHGGSWGGKRRAAAKFADRVRRHCPIRAAYGSYCGFCPQMPPF